MTQEDKDILLKDLCARLPYGVKIRIEYPFLDENEWHPEILYGLDLQRLCIVNTSIRIEEIKPYLRPMSSMTEEQKQFIKNKFCYDWDIEDHPYSWWACCIEIGKVDELIDWFLENHFDYRGLIPMGLAIDVTNLNIY
jgi:hypothetical protein